ncbi:MAG: DUF5994 family protein [Mycobacterium sp.]
MTKAAAGAARVTTSMPVKDPGTGRLALCERAGTTGAIDGAWWPKCRDLSVELPDLLTVFSSWLGPVHRVIYDPRIWAPAPKRIINRNAAVSVDPYRLVFGETIYLIGTHSRDAALFVVPPSCMQDNALRILRFVAATSPVDAGVVRRLVGHSPPAISADSR